MATAKLRDDHITLAQYNRLVSAVCRGESMDMKAVLDADDRVGYLSHEQGRALLKACVTAPHAVALLAVVQKRSDEFIRGTTSYLGMAFLYASLDGADVETVEYIVNCLKESSVSTLERDLLWTTTMRNVPLVLGAAIKTDDQPLVLQFMGLPTVQAYLTSLEASFEPCFIRRVAIHHHHQHHQWLALAMVRNMDAVVKMAAERCPLVTADVAWVHCASSPTGGSQNADLCARRDGLNCQVKTFHQAIQAGNVDLVRSMLEEVPALRRSRMDNRVTALRTSTLAPNSIVLLQCLLVGGGATKDAVVQALLHACKHGAVAASIAYLWTWVEKLDRNRERRDGLLWRAITLATSRQQLVALSVLLSRVRDWTTSHASDFITQAMTTKNEEFVCGVMELPVVKAYFKTKAGKGYRAIAVIGRDVDECACDSTNECAYAFAVTFAVSHWIHSAVRLDLRRVAGYLDKWWPAQTRKAAFFQCYKNSSMNTDMWDDLSQRFVRDVTWHHTREVYLVQRPVLPGLDHLGWLIATYIYVFDAEREYFRVSA